MDMVKIIPTEPKPEIPKEIKKLPESYGVDSRFEYHLVKRNENAAVYKDKNCNSWEVFRIKVRKGRVGVINGRWVVFPSAECVPTDKSFGYWAFHHSSEAAAMKKFEILSKIPAGQKIPEGV